MRLTTLRFASIAFLMGLLGTTFAAERVGGPASGDMVRVTVYGQPDLTTQARVASDNTISFPFVGQVQIGGISTAQAQANVARALERKGIVKNPQVNVLIEGFSAGDLVTVLGQVRQPGRYPVGDESVIETRTLLDLLAVAGGTTESASARVTVFRLSNGDDAADAGTSRVEVDLHELMSGGHIGNTNLMLRSGDLVIVPEVDAYFIYGQVRRPGRYPLLKNMTVMQAISVGGGITERGAESGLVVTRRANTNELKVNANSTDAIHAGDVIYVKERFF